ncbi:MAG: hypothetical protein RR795_01565 [Cetobacterium sp.]|uniref:hypothetical protein n=1 Tax=Cetobacterium sp. TaxID=2071632 RepID=UPI002FC5922F
MRNLIGKEMRLSDLDKKMSELDYYEEFGYMTETTLTEIIYSGNVCFMKRKIGKMVTVEFEIIIAAGYEESKIATLIKIIEIK